MTSATTSRIIEPVRSSERDRGATFIELVVATAIALVLVTAILQVIVFHYGKGAVRAALDEAARSAARSSSTSIETCHARATNVLADLLGGEMGDGVSVRCVDGLDRVTVTADVHFSGWFGTHTDYDGTLTASAAKEDR